MDTVTLTRPELVRRGQRLEYFTVAYNSLEGLVSLLAGLIAGSVSLVGFGLDSAIEVASGAALLWRLHHDLNPSRRERAERSTLRIVGWCFLSLAAYIAYESGSSLIRSEAFPASQSPPSPSSSCLYWPGRSGASQLGLEAAPCMPTPARPISAHIY